ncbi:MAG: NAD(+) synthase [Erysipelotrichaceae bacterium]|nr:NAD(+) synthase [Erysipelotrichaceae bacterium]MDY5251271.1 NAD(+) synthase [Erysipelotrichaceae bacterium]
MNKQLREFEQELDLHIEKIAAKIKKVYEDSHSNGFVIGMSGGIDCATVMALCHHANVPVIAFTMPYEANTSKQRIKGMDDAKACCDKFHVPLYTLDISQSANVLIDQVNNTLSQELINDEKVRLAKANVLPRMRMINLYYVAQLTNRLVIGTGNLSEIVMGYFTKWGDGANDFNPIKTLCKTQIYMIAKRLGVPQAIIDKQPSADLWDEQTDEKEMGLTYAQIDNYITSGEASEEVKAKISATLRRNKHKYEVNMFEDLSDKPWIKQALEA